MRERRGLPRALARLRRPRLGSRFVEVLDGERLVIEREPEFRRYEREPVPGPGGDLAQPVLQPAAVLLHLTGHIAAPVARAQSLEATGRTRECADGEVPAAVGAHERAAVHDAAVAGGPRQ